MERDDLVNGDAVETDYLLLKTTNTQAVSIRLKKQLSPAVYPGSRTFAIQVVSEKK